MLAETLGDTAAKPDWLTVHPLSREDAIAASALRASVATVKGKLAGTAARGPFDDVMERVAPPADVTFDADTVGGVTGLWARPARARPGAALMHIRGGWFNLGSARAYRNLSGTSRRAPASMRSSPNTGWPHSIAPRPR